MREALNDSHAIAKAMEYCHAGIDKYIIMHHNLKPDNIGKFLCHRPKIFNLTLFVSFKGYKSDGTLKIFDFELATMTDRKSVCSNQLHKMTDAGALRYMAPEVAKHLPCNYKAEVYTFGIILSELLSHDKPFAGMNVDEYFKYVVDGELRPHRCKKCPKELNQLMQKCWSSDIVVRPSFKDVVSVLESILINLNKKAASQVIFIH